jgi:hypothetical protein
MPYDICSAQPFSMINCACRETSESRWSRFKPPLRLFVCSSWRKTRGHTPWFKIQHISTIHGNYHRHAFVVSSSSSWCIIFENTWWFVWCRHGPCLESSILVLNGVHLLNNAGWNARQRVGRDLVPSQGRRMTLLLSQSSPCQLCVLLKTVIVGKSLPARLDSGEATTVKYRLYHRIYIVVSMQHRSMMAHRLCETLVHTQDVHGTTLLERKRIITSHDEN